MHCLHRQLDPAEVEADEVAKRLIMIAGQIDYARAVLGFLKDAADDVVVSRRPVPAFAQLPPVDDVADQIQGLAVDCLEEIEQQLGLAASGAEMGVGNEGGAHGEDRPVRLEVHGSSIQLGAACAMARLSSTCRTNS